MSIFAGSRYRNTPAYTPRGSDRTVFDIRERKSMDLTLATYHTWAVADRIDNLAYKLYGSSKYWWAILDANPQYQSPLDISVGDIVTIPPFTEVVRDL